MKKGSFEDNLQNIKNIIEEIEAGDLSLDESIDKYSRAMQLIKKSSEILEEAEGKIKFVSNVDNEINIKEE